jgi:hypothetical protein
VASTEGFNHDAVGNMVRARLTFKTQGLSKIQTSPGEDRCNHR